MESAPIRKSCWLPRTPDVSPWLSPRSSATPASKSPVLQAGLNRKLRTRGPWQGLAGSSVSAAALRELEARWGSRWRPGNAVRITFSRRKVIWDEILACTACGKSINKAVTELELLYTSRSLNSLVEELKRRRAESKFPAFSELPCSPSSNPTHEGGTPAAAARRDSARPWITA